MYLYHDFPYFLSLYTLFYDTQPNVMFAGSCMHGGKRKTELEKRFVHTSLFDTLGHGKGKPECTHTVIVCCGFRFGWMEIRSLIPLHAMVGHGYGHGH